MLATSGNDKTGQFPSILQQSVYNKAGILALVLMIRVMVGVEVLRISNSRSNKGCFNVKPYIAWCIFSRTDANGFRGKIMVLSFLTDYYVMF